MPKDEGWTSHQLQLGLTTEEMKHALPEATAQELVETLRDLLLLAGTAMDQEVGDED